ncbi:MAG: hypothetical protein NY202_02570 [Mollicutes bacterium UO1]
MLNKLTELEEETSYEGEPDDQRLVDEKSRDNLLAEIEVFCQEKGVASEQINDKLAIKLRSSGAINYQELIKKKVYSQAKLQK